MSHRIVVSAVAATVLLYCIYSRIA